MRKYRREPRPDTRSFPYPPDESYRGTTSLAPRINAERQALPPSFMRGEGHEVAGGVPRGGGGDGPLSHGFAPFLPPAFMRGEGHAVAGGVPPPQRGRPSQSRFARQLSQRESQGSCAPFLPPAFMRGEGHAVAGGVPRRSGDGPLSHGFAVPALPKGEPRALRAVLASRIYEGGGPRSGRGSPPAAAAGKASSVTAAPCRLPQRGSRGRCALITGCRAGSFGMAENVEIFRIFPEKGVAKPWGQWYNTNVSCMKSQREGRAPLFFLNFLPGAGPEEKGCAQ